MIGCQDYASLFINTNSVLLNMDHDQAQHQGTWCSKGVLQFNASPKLFIWSSSWKYFIFLPLLMQLQVIYKPFSRAFYKYKNVHNTCEHSHVQPLLVCFLDTLHAKLLISVGTTFSANTYLVLNLVKWVFYKTWM